MKDPLLLTYAIRDNHISETGPFLFDLSSRLQPISLRDQLFRANGIIRRALTEGLIRPGQEDPILVIGGGAAGLMATMVAMRNRVPVVLVERARILATQGTSRRMVCATEYDWPAPHWARKIYGGDDPTSPLVLKTGEAPTLLRSWVSQLEMWRHLYPNTLKLLTGRELVDYHQLADGIRVTLNPAEPSLPLFKMVVSCAGFGTEKTWLPDDRQKIKYRGFAFWEQDPFGEPNVALPAEATPNVLICGGGDGALQDFLRITCGKSAAEIYDLLPAEAREVVERRITEAEDRALRRFVWSSPGLLDHPIHHELHLQHQASVDALVASAGWVKVRRALDALIPPFMGKTVVGLAYACDHFSSCYPLNRFLVLLLSKYLEAGLAKQNPLRPRTKVVDVESLDHDCLATSVDSDRKPLRNLIGDPHHCHGRLHNLTYAEATCATFREAGSNPNETKVLPNGPFNVVIVRYGIDPNKLPLKHHAAALPMRQVIPYDSPW